MSSKSSFWRRYIFSTDHKVIGIQYALTSMAFMFFGFMLSAADHEGRQMDMVQAWTVHRIKQIEAPGQPPAGE